METEIEEPFGLSEEEVMVRDTVREAGGSINIQSVLGQGTRFDVRLPLALGARRSTVPPPATSGVHPRPSLVNRSVLVVDDDAAMRSMVRTALELHGAHVVDAADRAGALADPEARYDVALVDLSLGDERGDDQPADGRAEQEDEVEDQHHRDHGQHRA